jgi:hypothetical protein
MISLGCAFSKSIERILLCLDVAILSLYSAARAEPKIVLQYFIFFRADEAFYYIFMQ